jgi:hypothetical protein
MRLEEQAKKQFELDSKEDKGDQGNYDPEDEPCIQDEQH